MLIRSQNKEELVNLNITNITVVSCEIRAYSPSFPNDYQLLGGYENKDRAIGVMDEIERTFLEVGARSGIMHNQVYRMPEK